VARADEASAVRRDEAQKFLFPAGGAGRYNRAMQKLRPFLIFILLLVIFFVGLWAGFLGPRLLGLGSGPRVFGTATVLQQVQTLSEFVTVKYVMEKVVVLEDVKWYPGGDSRVLLLAHGIVKAGVDFKPMTADDVRVSGKTISLRLPPAKITDAYLDEKQTRVIERTTGLLRIFDKDSSKRAAKRAGRHSPGGP